MPTGPPSGSEETTLAERLTRQFYEWETRGRGWDVWEAPVELEPRFVPFFGHYDPRPAATADDGRRSRPGILLLKRLVGLFGSKGAHAADLNEQELPKDHPLLPVWMESRESLAEIEVVLPASGKTEKSLAEQFLLGLGHVSRPIAFELVGDACRISTQFVSSESISPRLSDQLSILFPDAALVSPKRSLHERWESGEESPQGIVEFGLSGEFVRPLRRFSRFDPDPLGSLIGAMRSLEEGEQAVYQVLFSPTVNPWAESMLRAASDGTGRSFFVDDPSMLALAGQKASAPLFGVVLRLAARGPDLGRVIEVVQGMAGALRQFTEPTSNELIPLTNDGYEGFEQHRDFLRRQSRRSGMLLNADELVSLVHLPSASIREPKLVRSVRKSKRAPEIAQGEGLVLGTNEHRGQTVRVTQRVEQRLKHTHLIGSSGTGKSTLLERMIVADIEAGNGLAVLDPHGDLVEGVLRRIPKDRTNDVVLIDPSDESYTVGFNILSAHSELERALLASDLVSVFERLSTSWGDQMTVVLSNAVLAFLESSRGGTLADLRRFLVEPGFRRDFLGTVSDPEVAYYWRTEFPLLRGNPHAPILTRLNTFLRPKPIRRMVTATEHCLDLFSVMNERKIVLAKLSQGLIGEENSYLLGTLLVSKLNQAAMSRQQGDPTERVPFFLYIDEFHNFVTPSMAAILSGARKYGLGLILAHQELEQISRRDSTVLSAVISNPYTRICFRVGDFDAKKLAEGFAFFEPQDLQNLGIGEAICRMERAEYDFNLRTKAAEPLDTEAADIRREEVVAASRHRYANRRPVEEASFETYEARPARPAAQEVGLEVAKPSSAMRAASPVDTTPTKKPQRTPPQLPGRGGRQHTYLQELVKRWAESHGYRATIEKTILDGLGSVDVALEKEGFSVACEISVSTSAEHELGNVTKCLAAGFDRVVVLGTRAQSLKKIAQAVETLEDSERSRVHCFQPEELFAFLEAEQAAEPAEQQTVRGYKVRVRRNAVSAVEEQAKRRVVAGAILQSLRKLKDDDQS